MIVCYHCGKPIRGTMKTHVPPKYLEALGLDFACSYHPKCYEEAEAAAKELIDAVTKPKPEKASCRPQSEPVEPKSTLPPTPTSESPRSGTS